MKILTENQVASLNAGLTIFNLKSGKVMTVDDHAAKGIMNAISNGAPFSLRGVPVAEPGVPGTAEPAIPRVEIPGSVASAYLLVAKR